MGKFRLKTKYLLLFIIIFVLFYSLSLSQSLFYPSDFKIIKGENKNLNISFPFSLDNRDVSIVETIFNEGKKSITLNGIDEGETNLQIKLLGLIPVKNYNVNVVNRPELVPGGNAIGVRMNTKGVLVVAVTEVINIKGNRISPARESGLKVGDSIIEINGEKISSAEQVVRILNNVKEEAVNIVVLRNKEEIINCVNRKINTILNSGTEDEKTKKSALETAIKNNSAMWDNVTTGIRFGQNYDFENFVEFYIDIVDYIASFTGFYIEYREVIIPIIK